MNDFQMSHLAAGRSHELRAEADRQRLARSAKRQQGPGKAKQAHHPRRFSLGWLLRRAVA
jgi:hypothetical protein